LGNKAPNNFKNIKLFEERVSNAVIFQYIIQKSDSIAKRLLHPDLAQYRTKETTTLRDLLGHKLSHLFCTSF
jgi:hypothetical protein